MTQGYGPDNGQQGQWGQDPQAPQWGQNGQDPQWGQAGQDPQWGQPEQQAPAPQPQWGQASPSQPQWGQASPSQPQWGQASPSQPQWGQASPSQPQWGQASPAAAPGGYPGAVGPSGMGTGPQFGPGDGVSWKRVKVLGLALLIGTVLLLLIRLGINLATFIGAEDLAASGTGGEVSAAGIGSSLASLVLYILNFLLGFILFVLGIVAAVMGRGRARVGGIVVAAAIPVSAILYWVFIFLAAVIMGITGVIDEQTTIGTYYVTAGTGVVHALVMVAIIALGSFFVYSTASKKLSA